MSRPCPSMRPLANLKTTLRQMRAEKQRLQQRCYATTTTQETSQRPERIHNFHPGDTYRGNRAQEANMKKIPTFPAPPSARALCKDPISTITATQISMLDPIGVRTRLFSPENIDRARVGDILLVKMKSGDPFAGVCLNVRRAGIDTAILLRNNLTRVGVEMWYKIYSPNVQGIEVVQRKERRARRAKLYYMRLPKHDVGSVENIVRQYQRQRAMLRSSEVKSRDTNSNKKKGNKRGSN